MTTLAPAAGRAMAKPIPEIDPLAMAVLPVSCVSPPLWRREASR
jgi:hypothetical protein